MKYTSFFNFYLAELKFFEEFLLELMIQFIFRAIRLEFEIFGDNDFGIEIFFQGDSGFLIQLFKFFG